ncbi:MAG: serine/threonine protein kinase [Myxococcota bacterium]|jgi:serine/threonine protein kinase
MRAEASFLGGRYRLHQLLGQGGMATVHRAYDHAGERWVAVKLLAPAVARHLSVQRRFAREAEVLQRLDHPNVVRLYEWHQAEASSFLAMELVEGRSLESWSRQHGPMPTRMAVEAAQQICQGVQAAHTAGIIHRDVKPANVLVSPGGACKVVDFGLARAGHHERLTRTGMTMGTYGFMAPEQNSDAAKVTLAADIYSVGATLLALLNGRPHLDIRHALNAVSAQLPLSLARALVNATLAEPGKRYRSLEDLHRALGRALRQLPPDPPPVPPLHLSLIGPDGEHPTIAAPSVAGTTLHLDEEERES